VSYPNDGIKFVSREDIFLSGVREAIRKTSRPEQVLVVLQ